MAHSQWYLNNYPPLKLPELEQALINKTPIAWHAIWPTKIPPDDMPPFRIQAFEDYPNDPRISVGRVVVTGNNTRVAVDTSGLSVVTKRPVFVPAIIPPEPEPKTNQGRYPGPCYWCGRPLVLHPGATAVYQICPHCRK